MKRYNPKLRVDGWVVSDLIKEHKEGKYVLYEDMVKVMEKLAWHFPIHEKLQKELVMEIIEEN